MQDIPNRSKRDLRGTCDSLQMNENEIKVIAAKYRWMTRIIKPNQAPL